MSNLTYKQSKQEAVQSSSCTIQGDSDLYGLGIRLGSYLQWLCIVVAFNIAPKEATQAINANSIFQLAMIIAIVWKVASSESAVFEVEAFIMTVFGMGGALTVLSTSLSKRMHLHRSSRIVEMIRLCLACSFNIYTMWFWFSGIYRLPQASCKPYTFFFAKVDLKGWFATFSRVLIVPSVLLLVVNLGYSIWDAAVNWRQAKAYLFSSETTQRNLQRFPEWTYLNDKVTFFTLLLSFGFFITILELCLRWNFITGVEKLDDVGQLIPFIMGLGGLIKVGTTLLFDKLEEEL